MDMMLESGIADGWKSTVNFRLLEINSKLRTVKVNSKLQTAGDQQ